MRTFRPDLSLCREVLNCSNLQHVRTTLSVRQALGFLSKAQLLEDRCNHPDDVDFRPNALIHKASIAIQIQTSGRRSSWSGRACIKSTIWMIIPCSGRVKPLYGNYLQRKCDRLDNRAPPSGRGSKTGKNFSEIIGQLIAQLSVRTAHDYRSDDA